MIDWPDDLVLAIARRRAVVFLGAGISRQSTNAKGLHPDTWVEFLDDATKKVPGPKALRSAIAKLIKQRDYLNACELIKEKLGDHEFHEFAKAKFIAPGFNPAPIHESVIGLDSRLVATPNFDKIFENRINVVQNNSIITKHYYDDDLAEAIRSPIGLVLKIHGTIDRPQQMIFTRTEYARARNEHRDFYGVLEALAITHAFLFLGCGLQDPDIQLILEDYGFLHRHAAPHYFVLPKDQLPIYVRPVVERSLNIKVLQYDPVNNHENLKKEIDDLSLRVNIKRIELANYQRW